MLDNQEPLWMPKGSVRAIIALTVVAAYIAGLIDLELAGVVVAFYFAARTAAK